MKAEELMIGDWVRNDIGECQRIVEIRESGAMLAYNDIYPYKLIEPIPITPEILEKNGFKSWGHGQIWKERIGIGGQTTSATSPIEVIIYEGGHSVIINPHEGKDFQGYIGSVHELQRVLRICWIEKEINVN